MPIVDLTQQIETGMQLFPLHSPTHVVPWAPRERYGWTTNALFLNEHAGTHLDAPFHFVEGGATIEQIDLAQLTGPALAIDLSVCWPKGWITAELIAEATAETPLDAGDALLIRTGAEDVLGQPAYLTDYPGLTEEAAQMLVERGVRLVGTDAPSIDQAEAAGFPAHHQLLPGGTLVVENAANLAELISVAAGTRFTLHTFPLKIGGGTGSPIRAVAVVDAP